MGTDNTVNQRDKTILLDEFQFTVDDLFVRNKSLIDAITKFQESNARVNRNISKAITQCGCIRLHAVKQNFEQASLSENDTPLSSHVKGALCDECRDAIEKEIGRNIFYLSVICNDLGINIYDVMLNELKRVSTLGNYSLR